MSNEFDPETEKEAGERWVAGAAVSGGFEARRPCLQRAVVRRRLTVGGLGALLLTMLVFGGLPGAVAAQDAERTWLFHVEGMT